MKKGDLVLVHGDDWQSRLIERATGSYWCHVAMVVDTDGSMIEAINEGVVMTNIAKYVGCSLVVDVQLEDNDRQRAVDYVLSAQKRGGRYGWLDILSIAIGRITGGKLMFSIDGQFICSQLLAEAYEHAGVDFEKDSVRVNPGDLARKWGADRPWRG